MHRFLSFAASSSSGGAEQPATSLRSAEQPATPSQLKIASIRDVQRWLAQKHQPLGNLTCNIILQDLMIVTPNHIHNASGRNVVMEHQDHRLYAPPVPGAFNRYGGEGPGRFPYTAMEVRDHLDDLDLVVYERRMATVLRDYMDLTFVVQNCLEGNQAARDITGQLHELFVACDAAFAWGQNREDSTAAFRPLFEIWQLCEQQHRNVFMGNHGAEKFVYDMLIMCLNHIQNAWGREMTLDHIGHRLYQAPVRGAFNRYAGGWRNDDEQCCTACHIDA